LLKAAAFSTKHEHHRFLLANRETTLTKLLHSASWRCMVQQSAEPMAARTDDLGVRITASLTKEQDRVLRALAAKHKVSVAWLVRYAVSQLVEQADNVQLPLDLIRRS
jgi:hypothetical protein